MTEKVKTFWQITNFESADVIIYKGGMKSSYDDMPGVDKFFDEWNPNTSTLMEEVFEQ